MKIKFICYNAAYMSYGFISHQSLCIQPPIQCDYETNEVITLKTGMKLQIFYCTKLKEVTKSKQRSQYIGITRVEEKVNQIRAEEEIPTSCSLSGRR